MIKQSAPDSVDATKGSKAGNSRAPDAAPPNARSSRTRELLILAAERLFGESGIEGVSLRQIGAEAGQGNTRVVQYHFNDKETLLRAIMAYRVPQMDARRLDMLAEAERQDQLGDIRTILKILCLPHLDLVDEEGRHPFARFMAEYMTRYRAMGILHPQEERPQDHPGLTRTLALISERLHWMPPEIIMLRANMCVTLFLNALVQSDNRLRYGPSPMTQAQILDEVLEIMTAALTAPLSSQVRNLGKEEHR